MVIKDKRTIVTDKLICKTTQQMYKFWVGAYPSIMCQYLWKNVLDVVHPVGQGWVDHLLHRQTLEIQVLNKVVTTCTGIKIVS